MNPAITCKVLNRLANRHSRESLRELNALLDHATQLLWRKQESFLGGNRQVCYPAQNGMNGTTIDFSA
jgi:hypothetical protein